MAASPLAERADGGAGVSGGAVHVAHPVDEMDGVIGVHVDEDGAVHVDEDSAVHVDDGAVHVEGMEAAVHVEGAGGHVDDEAVHVEAVEDEEEMTLDELERCVHLPNAAPS